MFGQIARWTRWDALRLLDWCPCVYAPLEKVASSSEPLGSGVTDLMRRTAWVYILECGDASLYVGVTYDVQRRLSQHQAGKGARYTRSHQPVRLVYSERLESLNQAMRREAEIRRWPRDKKLELIGERRSNVGPGPTDDTAKALTPDDGEIAQSDDSDIEQLIKR